MEEKLLGRYLIVPSHLQVIEA